MFGKGEYLTAQELGERLGVTAARVRQLVDERKLPEPTSFGTRANLWHRSALDAIKSAGSGAPITRQASLLDAAAAPLRQTTDALAYFPRGGSEPWQIHVRIFAGDAPEGQRTVVILSRPYDRGYADSFIEQIVEMVDDKYLDGRGLNAVWVEAYLNEDYSVTYEAQNLILASTKHLSRRERREMFDDDTRYSKPIWAPLALNDLDALIGKQLEWWPPVAYTAANIQRWQRHRTQLEVPYDPHELDATTRAFHLLRATAGERARIAQTAAATLAARALQIDAGHQGQTDDGTMRPERAGEWPSRWAARLKHRRLTDDERNQLDLMREQAKSTFESSAALAEAVNALHQWLDEIDEFSDNPDPDLADAVERAASHLTGHLQHSGDEGRMAAYPKSFPRVFTSIGKYDKRYLDSVLWDNSDVESRETRQLAEELEEHEIDYGRDIVNNTVARVRNTPRFAVMWPTFPIGSIDDRARIVADGDVGDRPVYIELDDHLVGVLAAHPEQQHDGRNFGYSGGGPATLAIDIAWHFSRLDQIAPPMEWIEDQVDHSDENELSVSVAELRRRAAHARRDN
jgi:hypothetical protein